MNITLNGMQKASSTFTSSSSNSAKTTQEIAAKYTYAKRAILGCAIAVLGAVVAKWAFGYEQDINNPSKSSTDLSGTDQKDLPVLNWQNISNITDQNLNSSTLVNTIVTPALLKTTLGADPLKNATCLRSESPALNPVKRFALEAVSNLIKPGSALDAFNSYGYNLVMQSVIDGMIYQLQLLIDAGAVLDLQNKHQDTALSLASHYNHSEAVTLLIKAGAPQNYRDKYGNTALFLAYHRGHLNVVRAFIAAGVDKTTVLDAIAKIITRNPTSPDQIEMVKLLIKECSKQDLETVNDQGDTFLMRASLRGSLEIVKLLIEAGVDLNNHNTMNWTTALMQATKNNHLDTLKYLIDRGAALNKQDVNGYTALHHAVIVGRLDAAKMLISNKADLNVRSHEGITPLMQACIYGELKLAEVLAQAKADLNAISDKKSSAIGYALNNRNIIIFNKLIDFKADPDNLIEGMPVLWFLVNYQVFDNGEQKLEAIRKLIKAGANKNLVFNGRTALQLLQNHVDEYSQRIKQILIESK